MKKQRSLLVPFLVVLLVGLVGGGAIVSVSQKIPALFYTSTQEQPEVLPPNEPLSVFQLHYVSGGGRFARIPLTYCMFYPSDISMTRDCGLEQVFLEIDLAIDPLPVDKIHSATTDGNKTLVYAVDSGKRLPSGCVFPELYVYDLEKHEAKQLKNDPSIWRCGAAGSHLSSTSPGGRYAFIELSGASEGRGIWVYDMEKDQLDTELAKAGLVTVFAAGADTQREDRYTLYVEGCYDFDPGCEQESIIKIRNNISGKIARMTALETFLKKKGIVHIQGMKYSLQDGSLSVWGDGLGTNVTVANFMAQVAALVD